MMRPFSFLKNQLKTKNLSMELLTREILFAIAAITTIHANGQTLTASNHAPVPGETFSMYFCDSSALSQSNLKKHWCELYL
jgi:hypothetical protein